MKQKHRDAGIIVAICMVLVVLLAGVYLINNGNGRDSSEFSNNTNSGSNVDYDPQSSSVLKVVDGGSSTTPAAAVPIESTGMGFGDGPLAPAILSEVPIDEFGYVIVDYEGRLFDAILAVEGDDGEVGPAGERGPYRITPMYWRDACGFGRVKWDYHKFVWSKKHCEQIMLWYWQLYGALTDEQKARCHNGGPDGHLQDETLEYWEQVKNLMEDG